VKAKRQLTFTDKNDKNEDKRKVGMASAPNSQAERTIAID
jgi:hypothetical protein